MEFFFSIRKPPHPVYPAVVVNSFDVDFFFSSLNAFFLPLFLFKTNSIALTPFL